MNSSRTISEPLAVDGHEIDINAYSLEGLTIMLVDDSKTILRSAEMYLSDKGCEVIMAEDGFQALKIIAQKRPDVIFMDIMMPKLDGYQACSLIKSNEEYADIPVVMLSSKHNLFDKARGRLSGSEEYLTKPFNHDDLIRAIALQMEHSRQAEDDLQPEFI